MISEAYSTGLTVGLSLILAIGAQNAFVLRQGLRNEHVLAVCLACAVSDAILIGVGVAGFGVIIDRVPWLDPLMRYGGATFLFCYGARSLMSALRSKEALAMGDVAVTALWPTLLTCLSLTWFNPHVYLDTVMLIGTISTRFPGFEPAFAAGAITASFLFFFSLGYGATYLRPVFIRPVSWRLLEAVIAVTMWALAIKLVMGK
ncbi:LysE/ArgO family amino acid transporter [Dyella flava]|uniref:Amino acid transporter n=1 Tax=Dyella flava TaxID=1920170 RepID=A0ABS2K212_9GAMM|nr:LysE/ArgO family amino acid transporter [Dyella flava]MBM7124798.1 amino acid transporter [Dyella flava]